MKALKSKNGKCYFNLMKSNKLERIEVTFSTVPFIKFNLELANEKDQKDPKRIPIGSPIRLEGNEMTISYPEKYFVWLHKSEGKLFLFHLLKLLSILNFKKKNAPIFMMYLLYTILRKKLLKKNKNCLYPFHNLSSFDHIFNQIMVM